MSSLRFKELTKIPGVVGAIDGTHVKIPAPPEDEYLFVNRKSYHSLNVGIASDFNLKIIWLCVKYGGSAHDSRVFRESTLHSQLQSGAVKGVLLGDSAYRAESFLLKPILNPKNNHEKRYTDSLCRGRVKVENCIGCLKRQFHSLHGELRYRPQKAALLIAAAVAFRNAAIDLKEPPFFDDIPSEDEDDDPSDDKEDAATISGQTFMNYVVSKYF
uniref:DDE Tnp4 domain-containing protein n=1 Tax=Caenorhabditis japonica TaxID=281687 RepID=A0A8R1EKW7_CAEJA